MNKLNEFISQPRVSLKTYVKIMNESTGLDSSFLRRAIEVTSFNLTPKDFASTKYKNEIRFLFTDAWFPNVDTSKVFIDEITTEGLNSSISTLRDSNKKGLATLLKYDVTGVGPGEFLLYYICTKGHLGGGSSAGVDITVNGTGYEIKAVDEKFEKTLNFNVFSNFKLGAGDGITKGEAIKGSSEIMKDLTKLVGTKTTSVAGSIIAALRSKTKPTDIKVANASDELKKIRNYLLSWDNATWKKNHELFNEIETNYRKYASNYFKGHEIIFISNSNKKATKLLLGKVLSIRKVKLQDIYIERATNGVIKPLIKV